MEDTSFNKQPNESNKQRTNHSQKLEAIDREQRLRESQEAQEHSQENQGAFRQPMVEALDHQIRPNSVPLLSQEELDDTESSRINWTAVVCTAIVAATAAIVLCVAQPWKNTSKAASEPVAVSVPATTDTVNVLTAEVPDEKVQTVEAEPAQEVKVDTVAVKKSEPEEKPQTVKPAESTLPVQRVSTTGTNNPYNNVRLINASERLLTKNEVSQMTKTEIFLARNAIYARHGYQFNNAELKEFFSHQKWFKATDVTMDNIPFTKTELANISLIKAQEQAK